MPPFFPLLGWCNVSLTGTKGGAQPPSLTLAVRGDIHSLKRDRPTGQRRHPIQGGDLERIGDVRTPWRDLCKSSTEGAPLPHPPPTFTNPLTVPQGSAAVGGAFVLSDYPSGGGAASPRQGRWDPASLRPALSLGRADGALPELGHRKPEVTDCGSERVLHARERPRGAQHRCRKDT